MRAEAVEKCRGSADFQSARFYRSSMTGGLEARAPAKNILVLHFSTACGSVPAMSVL
jgi:hypothetical protein